MARQKNSDLCKAKSDKDGEFFADFAVIEQEMAYYLQYFKGKTVFCNCNDSEESNFWRYFHVNFKSLGLHRLLATTYSLSGEPAYVLDYMGGSDLNAKACVTTELQGNGDFRSGECLELLKQADIVVSSPSFSFFQDYIPILMAYHKKFIILGNQNSVTYNQIFPLIQSNQLWYGASIHSGDRKFYVPDDYPLKAMICGRDDTGRKYIRVKGVRWFTNLDVVCRHEPFFDPESVHAQYVGNEKAYPKYKNFDAINVDKTKDIPEDYFGVMGVPISFLDVYNPDEFEIVGALNQPVLSGYGEKIYKRLLIKRKI